MPKGHDANATGVHADPHRVDAEAAPALATTAVSRHFPTRDGALTVLRGVSLTVAHSEAVAIMGPSGSGKSTLLNILGTLDAPSSGSVKIDGSDPFALSPRELARFRNRRIGFIFQDHHLLPQCSALENVLLPTLAERTSGDPSPRALELLAAVGLAHRARHAPAELSGGERQRVAIARALINRPALLLADEPTGDLDRTNAEAVAVLLGEIQRTENAALVVVTHSERLASRFPRRCMMDDGRLVPVS
ncbi:MAG: ABC transporter ATP-binding protein [Phycisphaerae bacterium]|jgi:lipoprotein-releasing system ATP-binding protein